MSLPAAPLVATANNPQGVGHPDTISKTFTALNTLTPAQGGSNPTVAIVQTDLATSGASAVLSLSGGAGAGGPVGASSYNFIKCCGPPGGGLETDHLQLYRYGPTGAVGQISEILDIGPKMVANPSLPALDFATLWADLTVNGAVAVNGPLIISNAVVNNSGGALDIAGIRINWGAGVTDGDGRATFSYNRPYATGVRPAIGAMVGYGNSANYVVPSMFWPGDVSVGVTIQGFNPDDAYPHHAGAGVAASYIAIGPAT